MHWGESGFFDQEAYDRSLARVADKLEISLDLLETSPTCANAEDADEKAKVAFLLSTLSRSDEVYRAMHLLDETHDLCVSLGRYIWEILERRGEIHRDGDGERPYLMAYGRKIWVEDDGQEESIVKGFVKEVDEGAKRKAPTTGPRRDTFSKRGKR